MHVQGYKGLAVFVFHTIIWSWDIVVCNGKLIKVRSGNKEKQIQRKTPINFKFHSGQELVQKIVLKKFKKKWW